MQQECGMCLQGSSYCWSMWMLFPGEMSEYWDCVDSGCTSWTIRADVGGETDLWVSWGNAEEDAPLPHCLLLPCHGSSWISLCPRCSFMLGWPRRANWSLGWRHGFLLSLHPRWLQVSTWLQSVQQSCVGWNKVKLREWWGLRGPMANYMSTSWKSAAYVLASLSW